MKLVVVSGMSGSGKSVVLDALEDAGFYCVDNLPLSQTPALATALARDGVRQAAVAVDVRNIEGLSSLPALRDALHALCTEVIVLVLDARTDVLLQRFSETRRRHPLSIRGQAGSGSAEMPEARPLIECLEEERELLQPLREFGETIDTSGLKAADLRALIRQRVRVRLVGLSITFQSFAFKQGLPLDSDLVFDVRCLPNPHYEPALKHQTGRDQAVIEFLAAQPEVTAMREEIAQYLTRWLPRYAAEPKATLTVSIGCTGGQHRSVYLVEQLAAQFRASHSVAVRHRGLLTKGLI